MLIRPGAIGDFILSLPALESLRADYTEVWCAETNVPLVGFADRVRSIGSTGLDRVGVLPDHSVFHTLRQFDEIHSWYGTAFPPFREAVRDLSFHFYSALPPPGSVHATDFYCDQVGAPRRLPRLAPKQSRADLAVIHPFASQARKRWPMRHFQTLFEQLARNVATVRWCAGPEEALDEAVRVADLGSLAQWLASARLFIGNDSGITHLAAALSIPVVALFGPTDPAIWAPRGPQVRILRRDPLAGLDPEEVFAIAQSLL